MGISPEFSRRWICLRVGERYETCNYTGAGMKSFVTHRHDGRSYCPGSRPKITVICILSAKWFAAALAVEYALASGSGAPKSQTRSAADACWAGGRNRVEFKYVEAQRRRTRDAWSGAGPTSPSF